MATVAFLIDAEPASVDLGPAVTDALARLGVTNLSLYRDRTTTCVVLDGWGFDGSSSAAAARAIGIDPARVLHPVLQSALRAARYEEDLP